VIALIPIVFFVECKKAKFLRLLYLIKTIRIFKAIEKIDIVQIMSTIKYFALKKIEYDISKDPALGEDNISDHNKILFLM